jgi:hypothetical protein
MPGSGGGLVDKLLAIDPLGCGDGEVIVATGSVAAA